MNELFKEAREHGAVPLSEATRSSSDDKAKVSAVLTVWDVRGAWTCVLVKPFRSWIIGNDCSP